METLEIQPEMSEIAFRDYASLCIRCGRGRRELESDLCGTCEYRDSATSVQIARSAAYFNRHEFLPKKKSRKSGSAA
jgi:hypothetical protein